MSAKRHGIRVTVRLNEVVVAQSVRWRLWREVTIGATREDAFPTPGDGPLARIRWVGAADAEVVPLTGVCPAGRIRPGRGLRWDNGAGVTVDLDVVPQQRARRFGGSGGGDIALLALILTLFVGVGQTRVLLGVLFPPRGSAYDITADPSPELIARLLLRQHEGAAEGLPERVERPEAIEAHESFYLPAGNGGDLGVTGGGGARVGDEVRREDGTVDGEPTGAEEDAPLPMLPESPPETAPDLDLAEGDHILARLSSDQQRSRRGPDGDARPEAMELFLGWGFRDWFEVADARPEVERDIARQLDAVRVQLAIDPDDPHALQLLGYYAYLAENHELGRNTYERYIRLYPDDPAGYNNLALTYKRTGDYKVEEALYRRALEFDPQDINVLNNLAVNLAHQGRGAEALRIMDFLEEVDPADPYADLHRAKVLACMGRREASYHHLKRALSGADRLDTLHHVEFRQDIRLDPAFDGMRSRRRFRRLVRDAYGAEADFLLEPDDRFARWGDHG